MIFHVTTAVARPGTLPLMMDWSQRVTAMIRENFGQEITVLRNVAGSGDEWHFMTTHDSLADLEAYVDAVSGDEQFHGLAAEATQNELWSTTRTSIYRTAF